VRTIKLFAVIGLAVALVAVPALAKEVEVKVTCENNQIVVNPNPARISLASDTVKWVISASGDRSVGACLVKDGKLDKQGQSLQALGLNKIEIEIAERGLLTLTPAKDPNNPHIGRADWKAGSKDAEITGKPLKVGSSKYTIRFLKASEEVILLTQQDIASIESTPTLTEWGLIALAVLLAGGMGYMIYRRRPALRPAAP
jgi:hypothetical protein